MTAATLAAIRAIVAIHGGYGRTALDAAIKDARRAETPSEAGIADVESGGRDGRI